MVCGETWSMSLYLLAISLLTFYLLVLVVMVQQVTARFTNFHCTTSYIASSNHYKNMVVIKNSWIVMMYSSAPWEQFVHLGIVFLCSFVFLGRDILWAAFLEKKRTLTLSVHLVHASSFSEVRVAHLRLIHFACILVISCSLSFGSIFPV